MEEETTTGATASPEEKETAESPNGSVEEKSDAKPADGAKKTTEKDVQMTDAGEGQKHGVKRKASEIEGNSEGEEEAKGEKKKKEAPLEGDDDKVDEVAVRDETEDTKDAEKSEHKAATAEETEQKDSVSSPSSQDSKDDLSLPEKQTLGKGKRARIPNKRYSDILMSPRHGYSDGEKPGKKRTSENGVPLEKENLNSEGSKTGAKPPPTKSSKIIDNPNLLKPFKFGWRRELVYRAALDQNAKRTVGDIYYYTPTGKKLRSMREVSENLKTKELSLEDFTFAKETLGLDDPEKEIVRDAKGYGSSSSNEGRSGAAKKKGGGAGLKVGGTETKAPSTRGQSKQTKVEKKSKDDEEMDVGTYPPNWQSPRRTTPRRSTTSSSNNNNNNETTTSTSGTGAAAAATNASIADVVVETNKPCRPCSILCRGVMGLVPTLQCRLCLCLYHNECVGVAPHLQVHHYECKNCQLEQEQKNTSKTAIPPPTTTTTTTTSTATTTNTTLKSQQSNSAAVAAAIQKIPPLPPPPRATVTVIDDTKMEGKSLVGGVTTWFPHSSTIQVGGNQMKMPQLGTVQAPRPQYVEFLGDKKYLIIPKHNVVSVLPSVGHTHWHGGGVKEPPRSPAAFKGFSNEDVESSVRVAEIVQGGSFGEKETPKRTSQRKRGPTTLLPTVQQPAENYYLQHLAFGYNTLLYVFQYLKVQDLLRAGCVCQMWHDVASHASLWRTVRMKNSQVHSFEGLANTLKKHRTVHLDLRKMLLANSDEIWPSFSETIKMVDSLRKIELCRCPAVVVEQLAHSNPDLEVINAVTIKCDTMSLEPFGALKNLKELRLKSSAGLTLTSDLSALEHLTSLTHLSLTSLKDLNKLNLTPIGNLENLESLDLGECNDLPKSFAIDVLSKLTKLEKLRLEKGQGDCHTFDLLEAVKEMPTLEQLELVNFDVKSGFDVALGACANIKKLLVIPTYISQSATTNHMVLGGVMRLRSTLSHFVWGVTLELLRVTELFVDQCDESDEKRREKKKVTSDCIPVLKPVPTWSENDGGVIEPAADPPQVEILSLQNLQKLLLQCLPTTRVKILKIPFHATWRQSITETVN